MLPKEFDNSAVPIISDGVGGYQLNPAAANIQRLMYNQMYTIQLTMPDGQYFEANFMSQFEPFYTSVRIIRQDLGDLMTKYTDEEIAFKIYQVSQTAQQLAADAQRFLLMGSGIGNIQLQYTGATRDWMRNAFPYPIPFYVSQYARYKTELDLVYNLYVELSSQSGLQEKDLGELKVIKQVLLPKISDVLVDLKHNLAEWENQVRGGAQGRPKWTMRARQKTPANLNRTGPIGGF